MSSYLRPAVAPPVFRDDDGRVIEYGRRWVDSPPADSYSVSRNPERFAPLHTIAHALIDHLLAEYDVEADDGIEVAADLIHPHPDVVRAVRIRPRDPACAALTFVFTGYPGILLHAGVLHDFFYPSCGCEACDEEWSAEADDLEQQVLAVVTGNYRESTRAGRPPWIESETVFPNGSSSSQSRGEDVPPERLASAIHARTARTGAWAPWPPAPRG